MTSTHRELDRLTEFTVTADHLKLLRQMHVGWDDCEFGAPAIDCKRPYGNSDVLSDIAEILSWPEGDDDGEYPVGQEEKMRRLHAEMRLVLQIGIRTGAFTAGRYIRPERWSADWIWAGRPSPADG